MSQEGESKRLSKKGFVTQTPEGDLLLVNEKGDAYKVNESVVAVWNIFEDKTVNEVINEIASQINVDPNEIKPAIEQLTAQLVEAELLA
ncbi:MAG TPA: PqqD family protein [Candidatus Caldiarchaeum subterraneum]|uniref:PqqD family protein n=1 Tax=Caldiarchaeum subterraneum TaxID=311458 RepID=A0A832ZX42_CALS0|nr:PqqD family protein [Aigarchaeota archaeon]HIQ29947.1 PqqD family protein [Candidatus Caldarchaeum subterraneum]